MEVFMLKLTNDQKEILNIVDHRTDYYFKVENAVVDDHKIFSNIYESHLFVILSRYCNNGKIAFPSYNTLAKQCYCSRSIIIRAMNSLIEKKLVNKLSRKKSTSDENDSNFYTINNIKIYEEKQRKSEGSVSDTLGGIHGTPKVVSEIHHHSPCGTPNKEQYKKNYIKKNYTKKHIVLFDKFLKQIEKAKTNKYIGKFLSEKNISDLFEISDNDFTLTKLFDTLDKTQIQISNFNYIKGILNNLLSEQEIIDQIQKEKEFVQVEKLKEEKIKLEKQERIFNQK